MESCFTLKQSNKNLWSSEAAIYSIKPDILNFRPGILGFKKNKSMLNYLFLPKINMHDKHLHVNTLNIIC